MLLDKYVITKAFESLLSYHDRNATATHVPPASFVKRVHQSMNRIDPLLKTLAVRPSPPEGIVQAYLGYIGDRSDTNFKKILDLKGVRKQEQGHLLELFQIHRDGAANDRLVQNSPLLTPLMSTSGLGSSGLGVINPTAALTAAGGAARLDATSIGERLLSAAREIGTSSTNQATTSAPEKATINENLKNFGRFFKQDIGGFAARFGKRDGSQGPSGEDPR
jgi:hypothetical protein